PFGVEMAVPGHRLQEISDNLCVRWELIRVLRGVSREPAGYCDRENRTPGDKVTIPVHLFRLSLTALTEHECGHMQPGTAESLAGTKPVQGEIRPSPRREPTCLHS